ncbi:MAG: DUF2975 domain-containing protein [Clostridia bacterium]|jgi:hypothetical protein
MYKNSVTHYIAKALVDIMFFGGIVCTILSPWIAKSIRDFEAWGMTEYWIVTLTLFASGVCSVFILYTLKQMFKTLLGGNPFVEANVNCFRKMAVACSLISLIYIVRCFLIFTIASVTIVLVFAIGTLFCLTLKDIFKQAVFYKEEHDWTV